MSRLTGLVNASRPRRIEELRTLDAQVRQPLALSTRVGFVGTVGGAGCSTAAGLASSVLARRRGLRVLGANASGSARSVLWHAGITSDATSTAAQERDRASASTASEVLEGLRTAPSGMYGIDLARQTQADDSRWWEAVAPISRFFDFVVTDWGVRDVPSTGHVLAASTLLAIVSTTDRVSLQHAIDLAAAAYADQVPSVVVLMPARRRAPLAIGEIARAFPVPVVRFPRDRRHGAATPVPSTGLRDSTNLAAIRLAAALVRTARARGSQGREEAVTA